MLYVLNYIVRHHTLNLNENISENIEKKSNIFTKMSFGSEKGVKKY